MVDDGRRWLGKAFNLHLSVLGLPFIVLFHQDSADQAFDGILIGVLAVGLVVASISAGQR